MEPAQLYISIIIMSSQFEQNPSIIVILNS